MSERKPLRDGDVIGSAPINPCRCGASTWAKVGGDLQCKACGVIYYTETETERVLTSDGYVRVHTLVRKALDDPTDRDEMFRYSTGRDDQRPDHDPDSNVYRPVCVMQHMEPQGDTEDPKKVPFYTYLFYCGKCLRKWGGLGVDHDWTLCPHCGATIGNYVFSDGMEHWFPSERWSLRENPPEVWEP